MDPDLMLVLGVVIGLLSLPSLLTAYSSSDPPRVGAFMIVIAAALITLAVARNPGGYAWHEVPDVFVRVIGKYTG